jgi:hypothetical protein
MIFKAFIVKSRFIYITLRIVAYSAQGLESLFLGPMLSPNIAMDIYKA